VCGRVCVCVCVCVDVCVLQLLCLLVLLCSTLFLASLASLLIPGMLTHVKSGVCFSKKNLCACHSDLL